MQYLHLPFLTFSRLCRKAPSFRVWLRVTVHRHADAQNNSSLDSCVLQIDEFGEVPKCKYHFPASCEPSNMCTYKFPGCQLSDGYKKWRKVLVLRERYDRLRMTKAQMNKMMSENVGALANALGKMPKCGEPGQYDDRGRRWGSVMEGETMRARRRGGR
eukprot:747462-Hanusia_phi.AAC.1